MKNKLILICWFSLILSFANGFISQLQYNILGKITFPAAVLKVIPLIIILPLLLLGQTNRKLKIQNSLRQINKKNFLLFVYLFIIEIPLQIHFNYSSTSMIFDYILGLYFTFFMLILISGVTNIGSFFVSEITVTKFFLFLGFFLGIIGSIQYMLKSPLVLLSDPDILASEVDDGRIRSFSLLTSSLAYGIFEVVCGVYCFTKVLYSKKIFYFGLFLFFTFCVYTSFTRNIYLTYILALITAILIRLKLHRYSIFKFYPLIGIVLSSFILFYSAVITGNSSSRTMDNSSTEIRIDEWKNTIYKIDKEGLFALFFGTGKVQNSAVDTNKELIIDNDFVSLIYQVGIFGMLFYLICLMVIFNFMLKFIQKDESSILQITLISVFCTYFQHSIFNIAGFYQFIALFFVLNAISINNRYNHATI